MWCPLDQDLLIIMNFSNTLPKVGPVDSLRKVLDLPFTYESPSEWTVSLKIRYKMLKQITKNFHLRIRVILWYTKLGMSSTFVLLKFENKSDVVIIFQTPWQMQICIKFIQLVTISNIFPVEIVQIYQFYQVCALLEKSIPKWLASRLI